MGGSVSTERRRHRRFVGAVDRRTALAVEASTPTWHFADAVHSHVGDLRIVDPVKTKLKAGYAAKTDRLDARRLADALRRDSVVGILFSPGPDSGRRRRETDRAPAVRARSPRNPLNTRRCGHRVYGWLVLAFGLRYFAYHAM